MKKKILLTLTLLFILSISSMVYAVPPLDDDKSYGDVTFKGNVPSDLDNVTILFEILNTTTNEKTGVELSYLNNFETSFFAEFGDYEIIPSTTKVLTKDRKNLDCYVNFVPFTVGMNNPNGDWTWIINVDVTKNFTEEEESEKDEFEEAIINYLNNSNGNGDIDEDEKETDISKLDNTSELLIPKENEYFPNMSLNEIKKWYVIEVEKFINTGKTNYTLEKYKNDICIWADYCFEKKENQAKIEYQAMVLKYDKDDTRDFYEVQKKMYDFIKDYQETTGLYLNFEVWDDTTVQADTIIQSNNEEKTSLDTQKNNDNIDKDNKTKEKNPLPLIIAFISIALLIVVVVIVLKLKSKKSN